MKPSLELDQIPSAAVAPERAQRSKVRAAMVKSSFGRRAFIRGAFATAATASVASLDLLPFGPKAAAAPSTHWGCDKYSAESGGWDNGWWSRCNPCASGGDVTIAKSFCNSNGYHRRDTVQTSPGYFVIYRRRHQSCQYKNAWVWRIRNDPSGDNPRDKRCSDGRRRVEGNGNLISKGPTVCKKPLPRTGPVRDRKNPPAWC